jgi:cation diffusion facilitator family transporter
VIAGLIAWESMGRFFRPLVIRFDEAIGVAVLGLLVNLLSVYLLREEPHEHGHAHAGHDPHHHAPRAGGPHHDHNRRAAYLHVLADTLTSGTAILALLTGRFFGWVWMDPLMGIVGSVVIARWSIGLLRETSSVLLDGSVPTETFDSIRELLEAGAPGDLVSDLHVWPLGPGQLAVIAALVSDHPRAPDQYKSLLADRPELVHVTIEVNPCAGHGPEAA